MNEIEKTNIIDGGDTDLTPIEVLLQIDENGQTTAKKLYEFLQLDDSHYARWVKRNIEENNFAEKNVDFIPFAMNGDSGGAKTFDYKITATFAKKLCMTAKGERGEQARNYFIKIEDILKQKKKEKSLVLPTDYETALEELLKEVKKNKKLSLENGELKETIKDNEPKLEIYERMMNGQNTISMNEVAKTLNLKNMGRTKLFKILKEIKILMSNNTPYQRYLNNNNYFKVVFKPIKMSYGIENVPVTRVTAKGLQFIHKQLKKHEYIDEDNNLIKNPLLVHRKNAFITYDWKLDKSKILI